jgi:hypothetical protein
VCLPSSAAVTIKGTTKVGLNLLITTLHPMRIGATLMSSMLFNVGLVLLSCLATIQFCSQVMHVMQCFLRFPPSSCAA